MSRVICAKCSSEVRMVMTTVGSRPACDCTVVPPKGNTPDHWREEHKIESENSDIEQPTEGFGTHYEE